MPLICVPCLPPQGGTHRISVAVALPARRRDPTPPAIWRIFLSCRQRRASPWQPAGKRLWSGKSSLTFFQLPGAILPSHGYSQPRFQSCYEEVKGCKKTKPASFLVASLQTAKVSLFHADIQLLL